MNRYGNAVLCLTACTSGCVTTLPPPTKPSQIEALQSRGYENDKALVFASVVSVFQDLGYIIDTTDRDAGVIAASSPTDNRTNLFDVLSGEQTIGRTRAIAFVEELRPDSVMLRLNFIDSQRRSSPGTFGVTHAVGRGMGDRETMILDPKPYQVAFERVAEAIAVRSGIRAKPRTAGAP